MSESGHDIQVCLCKTLKLLSQTCASFTLKHPVLFISTLCVFLLYVAFPFAFWVLVYSVPFVVSTIILVLSFNTGRPTDEGEVGRNSEPSQDKNSIKRPITRVHSVRRRRAKEFARDEGKDKTDISTTVSKDASSSPKDIREVEVVLVRGTKSNSLWDSQTPKHDQFDDLEEGKEVAGDNIINKSEEEDHEKNKMDVVISDSETTKRLESLIARRRLRKLLSLEVRRSLMNKDRNQDHQISSFAAKPKINNMSRLVIPSRGVGLGGGPRSPVPGSAPSVMIQMRNPFDLPYDPQEEKPDLTGDGFEQEFMSENHRDTTRMFCRHESFTLRPFLPGEFNRSLKEISSSSSFPDSRSSKPTLNSPDEDEDQIKEIIQVHENSSSEDDEENGPPVLLSLSTTAEARRHVTTNSVASDLQVEVSELSSPPLTIDENLSYVYNDDEDNPDADSWAGEYESRLAQEEDEMSERVGPNESQLCDHPWCSIASCRSTSLDEMIDKTLQRSVSLAGRSSSSRDDDSMKECAHRLNKSEEESSTLDSSSSKITSTSHDEGRLSNEWHGSIEQGITPPPEDSRETGQNEQQELIEASGRVEVNDGNTEPSDLEVGQGSPSPKSVLHTTCSLASFDNDNIDDEVRADRVLSTVQHGGSTEGDNEESSESAKQDEIHQGQTETTEEISSAPFYHGQ